MKKISLLIDEEESVPLYQLGIVSVCDVCKCDS